MYSYLLFEAPPKDEAERHRYLKALEAYLVVLQPMAELERHKRRSQLNVTLIPVREVELPADLGDPNRASPDRRTGAGRIRLCPRQGAAR